MPRTKRKRKQHELKPTRANFTKLHALKRVEQRSEISYKYIRKAIQAGEGEPLHRQSNSRRFFRVRNGSDSIIVLYAKGIGPVTVFTEQMWLNKIERLKEAGEWRTMERAGSGMEIGTQNETESE